MGERNGGNGMARKAEVLDGMSMKTRKRARMKRKVIGVDGQSESEGDVRVVLNYRDEMRDIERRAGPPSNWRDVYERIRCYREENEAPVDMMGCSILGQSGNPASEQERRYRILVSLLLSSRTKDEMTARAMKKLTNHGLNIPNIINTDYQKLIELISDVGFKNKKAKYILETTKILHDQYHDDIPRSVNDMMKLPGIGPKMAYLLAAEAWDDIDGIGVDTHVHRISNRLGWAHSQTPEQTRFQLQSWLPKRFWRDINSLLVGFGQTVCTSINPKCAKCPVGGLCAYGMSNSSESGKKGTMSTSVASR